MYRKERCFMRHMGVCRLHRRKLEGLDTGTVEGGFWYLLAPGQLAVADFGPPSVVLEQLKLAMNFQDGHVWELGHGTFTPDGCVEWTWESSGLIDLKTTRETYQATLEAVIRQELARPAAV